MNSKDFYCAFYSDKGFHITAGYFQNVSKQDMEIISTVFRIGFMVADSVNYEQYDEKTGYYVSGQYGPKSVLIGGKIRRKIEHVRNLLEILHPTVFAKMSKARLPVHCHCMNPSIKHLGVFNQLKFVEK